VPAISPSPWRHAPSPKKRRAPGTLTGTYKVLPTLASGAIHVPPNSPGQWNSVLSPSQARRRHIPRTDARESDGKVRIIWGEISRCFLIYRWIDQDFRGIDWPSMACMAAVKAPETGTRAAKTSFCLFGSMMSSAYGPKVCTQAPLPPHRGAGERIRADDFEPALPGLCHQRHVVVSMMSPA